MALCALPTGQEKLRVMMGAGALSGRRPVHGVDGISQPAGAQGPKSLTILLCCEYNEHAGRAPNSQSNDLDCRAA